MEKLEALKNYEKEFSQELKNSNISLDELYDLGLTEEELKVEMFLRSIYGDSTIKTIEEDKPLDEGSKTIEKINQQDIVLNRSLSNMHEEIEQDKFNTDLEGILAKVNNV